MEKILIFLGLKVVEILGIIFIPYYLGRLFNKVCGNFLDNNIPKFLLYILLYLIGCGVILLIELIYFIITMAIPYIIQTNWEWTEMLIK